MTRRDGLFRPDGAPPSLAPRRGGAPRLNSRDVSSRMSPPMQRTPLYDAHLRLGAKMVDFGGWAMPVSYPGGILDEHRATREAVGVFDVCHMGEIHFRGSRAAEAVQRLVTNDVGRLTDGRALYTVACLPTGGILDDLIVYRIAADHYLTVVNASTLEKDRAWFFEHARPLCDVADASAETGLIAFQGPGAKHALQPLTKLPLGELARFAYRRPWRDRGRAPRRSPAPATRARTGSRSSAPPRTRPRCGIGCSRRPPASAASRSASARATRSGWRRGCRSTATTSTRRRRRSRRGSTGWSSSTAPTSSAARRCCAQKQAGITRKLCGFVMTGRGIARHGYPIHSSSSGEGSEDGEPIGIDHLGRPCADGGEERRPRLPAGRARSRRRQPLGRLPRQARRRRSGQGPFYKRGRA